MHSVILHFLESEQEILNHASLLGINDEYCRSVMGEEFMFWSYHDYDSEYSCEEKNMLEHILGARPVCGFQVLARAPDAKFALIKVIELLSMSFRVMDDDIEKIWTLEEISEKCKSIPEPDLYNLNQ